MQKLKDVRVSKGLSQERVAQLAHVSFATVSRCERGFPVTPSVGIAICEVLGVSPSDTDINFLNRVKPAS